MMLISLNYSPLLLNANIFWQLASGYVWFQIFKKKQPHKVLFAQCFAVKKECDLVDLGFQMVTMLFLFFPPAQKRKYFDVKVPLWSSFYLFY